MPFDAVILAGGRSSRLGGVPKAQLVLHGQTLLERSLQAASGARRSVVVGPGTVTLPPAVLRCREDPPFGGPAAAIAAGLAALAGAAQSAADGPAPRTLVIACDMPMVADAIPSLLETMANDVGSRADAGPPAPLDGPPLADAGPPTPLEGAVAVSADGRTQPLVGLYSTAALQRAVDGAARRGELQGGSVFALLASLDLRTVPVPPGSTDDVDTWDDASALGVSTTGSRRSGGPGAVNDLGGMP
ncbi:molybdenum cofactor guanylyltransferase [Arthrobacter sp. B3I4]|uniref:molybdenum cofactor guanylyltransferase n=1 Tax=Arthrobacter sp. B3I4 TaxID=3042267 RepID=UPI00278AFC58|nr:NTP transferase domain-containing protein [Arthrobacter sp. B3I4]MDQ0754097.1 molybdopterin-guanine dinucleotide biosynthesis protein A [Arthrobacter sp. B3I4]